MQEFYWIFNGDYVTTARGIDAVDHRCQGRGLTRTGGTCYEDQPTSFLDDPVDHRWQSELCAVLGVIGNDAKYDTDSAALLKDVGAKSSKTRNSVADVHFRNFFETLFLAIRHHGESHVERVVLFQSGSFGDRVQLTCNAHHWECTHF